MPPRPEHYALRLLAFPGPEGDDRPLAGELEAVYSGECRAFDSEAGLLAALRALRQAAPAAAGAAPTVAAPAPTEGGAAATPPGPADAAQRRTSRSP